MLNNKTKRYFLSNDYELVNSKFPGGYNLLDYNSMGMEDNFAVEIDNEDIETVTYLQNGDSLVDGKSTIISQEGYRKSITLEELQEEYPDYDGDLDGNGDAEILTYWDGNNHQILILKDYLGGNDDLIELDITIEKDISFSLEVKPGVFHKFVQGTYDGEKAVFLRKSSMHQGDIFTKYYMIDVNSLDKDAKENFNIEIE
jgi:hypothetical protein